MKIFTFLILLLFSISANGQTAAEYAAFAEEKYEEQAYDAALTLVEKSIALDSTNIWSRLLIADILLRLDRATEAEQQLIINIRNNPNASEAHNRLGLFYLEVNDLNKSIFYYSKAIEFAKSDSISFTYYVNRATAKGVLRQFDESIKDFEKAYAYDSSDMAVLNNLAAIYQEVGQKQKGIRMLKRLAILHPEMIGAYVNLGLIYSEIDSLKLSEFYFDKALEIDPKEPLLLNNKGYLHYKKKEYNTALRYINESIDLYPANSYAYRNRALVNLALKRKNEACKDLSIAEYLDFKMRYGNEVEALIEKNCQ